MKTERRAPQYPLAILTCVWLSQAADVPINHHLHRFAAEPQHPVTPLPERPPPTCRRAPSRCTPNPGNE